MRQMNWNRSFEPLQIKSRLYIVMLINDIINLKYTIQESKKPAHFGEAVRISKGIGS